MSYSLLIGKEMEGPDNNAILTYESSNTFGRGFIRRLEIITTAEANDPSTTKLNVIR